MAKVKVTITNEQKKIKIPVGLRGLIRRACIASLKEQGFDEGAEVSVLLVDDERIHGINFEHRNIDRATDVLSFPLGENGEYDLNPETELLQLGDVVISLERAAAQAEEYGHSFEREVGYLTVHSVMHLLGYDHVNGGKEAVLMRDHEETVMEMLGLPR